MALAAGTRIGPYEIVAAIGEGGMGEVYRAHDARLRRDVAVKVLPAAFATDDERLRRFEQEAHATAALNHPNILAVYDVGRAEDTAYVVTELLEGHTLREAITGGPLPVRKVIHYATQVAAGLAAAHDKGIVHRDLKPENLFVTTDERVKILDFGLAKTTSGDGSRPSGQSASAPAAAQTALAGGTEPGMVLGTIGYMAPEQVRGQAVDYRADIFSFGAILFELLTGRRAFSGDTAADTMTAILKEAPPDLATSGPNIPPALARVVDRCLEKNPAVRFQSASDLGFALQTLGSDARSGSSIVQALPDLPKDRRSRPWLVAAGALALGALLAAGAVLSLAPEQPPPALLELDVAPPPGHMTEVTSALSPDGTRLVFAATANATRRTGLWLRTLASGALEAIEGTDDARNPFWSPDGTEIGYFAGGRLRAIDLERRRVRVIAEAPGVRTAGTWNQDGVILFATESGVPLKRVRARGQAEPVALEAAGFRPHFLPDGRRFLFHDGAAGVGEIRVGDLESSEIVDVTSGRDATYASGYLMFVRQQLLAQPFGVESLTLTGEPVVLAETGSYPGSTGPNYSVAGGLIAFRRGVEGDRQLVWYARDGSRIGVVEGAGMWRNPSFAPDDTRIAVERDEKLGTGTDIWIVDVARGTSRVLSAERAFEFTPVWSSDGTRVVFRLGRAAAEGSALMDKPVDGGAATEREARVPGTLTGFTPDGRSAIAFSIVEGNRDILIVPLDGSGPPVPFAQSAFNETQPALSPDGRWLAYVSGELAPSNTAEVFIQAFPDGGSKVHVTADTGGGLQPRWRRDGRELYFVARDGRLMAVPVDASGGSLRLGPAQALFQTAIGSEETGIGTRANYDVTRDGQRIIVSEPIDAAADRETPITVLVNWMSALAAGPRAPGPPAGAR